MRLSRRPPVLALHLACAALATWLLAVGAGGPVARWGPAAVVGTWLLAFALVALPRPRPSRAVVVAVAGLAGYVAWSALSVFWSPAAGDAHLATARLVAPAALFALAALWPPAPRRALLLVGVTAATAGVVAAWVLLRLLLAPGPELFVEGRLAAPAGYPNAAAMAFELALWPAVLVAAARCVPPAGRAAAAGSAVVLVQLVLLTQSRGGLLALPLTALVALALLPGRMRLLTALALVSAGVVACAPVALEVAPALAEANGTATPAVRDALSSAAVAALGGGAIAAALAAAWAAGERRLAARPRAARTWHRAGAVLAATAVVTATAAAVLAAGGVGAVPDRAQDAWRSFKGGYATDPAPRSRLAGGFGSDRYDFFRVALQQFRAAPLHGAGSDQFRAVYLREGRGRETPRHPHSLELRLLSQTGIVGALLFAAFVGGAASAALRAARRRGAAPSGAASDSVAAAAGLAGFAAWIVHGSADWFLELPGLTAVAFLLLGHAAAAGEAPASGPPPARSRAAAATVCAAALATGAAVAGPWLADRDLARAGKVLAERPAEALARLDRAARLDPLGAGALRAEGTARLRLRDRAGADAAFAQALEREPEDLYATLMRGALASASGDRRRAERLLARSVALAPRFDVARQALRVVRSGRRVDLPALQRELLRRGGG